MRLGKVADLRHPRSERAVAQPPRDEAAEAAAPSEEGALLTLQDAGERVAHALAQHAEVARHVGVLRRHNLMETLAIRHEGAEPRAHLRRAVDGAKLAATRTSIRAARTSPNHDDRYFSFSAPSSRARSSADAAGRRASSARARISRSVASGAFSASARSRTPLHAAQPPPPPTRPPPAPPAKARRRRLHGRPSPNELRGDADARACAGATGGGGCGGGGYSGGPAAASPEVEAESKGGGGVPKGGGGGVAAASGGALAAAGGGGNSGSSTGCASSRARS